MRQRYGPHAAGIFGMPSGRSGSMFDENSGSSTIDSRAPTSGAQGLRARTPFSERETNTKNYQIPPSKVGKLCDDLGRVLLKEQHHTSNAVAREEHKSRTAIDSNIVLCRLGEEILWLKVAETVDMGRASRSRTIGCIGEEGKKILMTAHSGMKTLAPPQGNLLDNSSWTQAVWEFCSVIGHKLPRNCYDHGIEGQFKACHVEPKLMLWFVAYYITNTQTGLLDVAKLQRLKQRLQPLRAVLRLDKDACESCMAFRDTLEKLTGIVFEITVVMTVGQTEQVKEKSRTVNRLVVGGFKPVKDIIDNQLTAGRREKVVYSRRKSGSEPSATSHSEFEDEYQEHELPRFQVTINPFIQVVIQRSHAVHDEESQSVATPKPRKEKHKQQFKSPPLTPRKPMARVEKNQMRSTASRRPSRHNGLLFVASTDQEAFSFHQLDALKRKCKNSKNQKLDSKY